MPTALELLETEACDDILVVDLESRTIIIPKNVSVLGVEADDETRILHFRVPRYYCEVDLSEFLIRINYKNAKGEGDLYLVTDSVVDDELIKFDWVVGRRAFAKKGNVDFSVCLKDVFEGVVRREFNTTIATLPVLEGLETGTDLVEGHTDIFEQLREDLSSNLEDLANIAVGEYIAEHPDDVKGPKGDAFEYEDFTREQLEELKGPKGDPGTSIKSIARTSGTGAPGTTDTYTVTLTNGSTTTFHVYNGANGEGAGDMTAMVYDPQGKKQDIFQYVDDAVANIDLPDIDLPDDIGDMQASVYDPNGKAQDIFKYVDDAVGIPNLGENITEGSANDITAFWAEKGSGQAWFSAKGMLVNQPAQYGFVISYTNGADVFQMFSDQTDGVTYFRYGDNVNNWFRNWSQILTANADGIFVTESNIEAHYLQGEWLQTTTTENHRTEPAEKIAVLDGSGWVYHRTPAEILSDIGAASEDHNQAASTITAGTFAGQVVAKADAQTPGTSLLRNSKLVSADTNPSNNGEINWTYG